MAYQFTQTAQELQYLFNEVEQLAGDYDGTVTYAVGDYCNYLGVVYKCTAATTGTFDAADWTSIIVLDELEALTTRVTTAEGDINTLNTNVSHIGQYVIANGGSASTISLSASTFSNVCSISLPPGKWIVNGSCRFGNVAAGTRHAGISTASATSQIIGTQQVYAIDSMFTLLNPTRMMSISTTTTVYLVVYSNIACTVDNAYLQAFRVE